jgi:hypothetical protein
MQAHATHTHSHQTECYQLAVMVNSSMLGYAAIVLAGGGDDHRMNPIVACDASPKVLLPVALRPMIAYPMAALASAGVRHVYIVSAVFMRPQCYSANFHFCYQHSQSHLRSPAVLG